LGAAYAAGLAEGYWKSMDDLRANWKLDRQWNPALSPDQRKNIISKWKKAVVKSFDWED
jgi:glycerol kinase